MATVKKLRSANKTILLLEDHAGSRRTHAAVLSTHGYEVSSAANAADAHSLWGVQRHDLVVLAFSCHDAGVLRFLEFVLSSDPEQRVVFLHDESLYLCPVFHENRIILRGEGPDDFVQRIGALLA